MILVASAARTSSNDSGALAALAHFERLKAGIFTLDVTAAAAASGDLLDVYIQHSADGGTTFDDFVHFTQVLGNGGAKKFLATWLRDVTPTSPLRAPKDAALAAGVNQGPVGATWRVKWGITDGGAHGQSFTFSVSFQPLLG